MMSHIKSGSWSNPSGLRQPVLRSPTYRSSQITVIVGSRIAATTFHVHQNLACKHSSFFTAAMRNGWKEAEQRSISLPEDAPHVFEIFASFIYFGKIYTDTGSTKLDGDGEWLLLEDCWVLGDKLGSITFKDAIVDAMCDKIRVTKCEPHDSYVRMYPVSLPGSPVRQLLVDVTAYWGKAETMKTRLQYDDSNEFFKDVAVKLLEECQGKKWSTAPFLRPGCTYHEHVDDDSTCYRSLF